MPAPRTSRDERPDALTEHPRVAEVFAQSRLDPKPHTLRDERISHVEPGKLHRPQHLPAREIAGLQPDVGGFLVQSFSVVLDVVRTQLRPLWAKGFNGLVLDEPAGVLRNALLGKRDRGHRDKCWTA